jgi:RNA polymerase sigma-B factor
MNPSDRNPGGVRETFTEFADSRDEGLRNTLVEQHLGLAHQLARRFTNRGEPYDDLVQVASMALVKSVDRFDADRGVEFSTFATRTIIGELKRHFRDKGWAIRAPRRIQELYLALGPSIETLTQQLGRPPTVSEIAGLVDASEESVLEAMEAGQRYRTTSIDAPNREEGTLSSRLGEVDSGFTGTDDRLLLALSLADLPERERTIINLRFVEGLTQSEIAARVGLSQMHVSRLLAASLAQLRESFVQDP